MFVEINNLFVHDIVETEKIFSHVLSGFHTYAWLAGTTYKRCQLGWLYALKFRWLYLKTAAYTMCEVSYNGRTSYVSNNIISSVAFDRMMLSATC